MARRHVQDSQSHRARKLQGRRGTVLVSYCAGSRVRNDEAVGRNLTCTVWNSPQILGARRRLNLRGTFVTTSNVTMSPAHGEAGQVCYRNAALALASLDAE